MTRLWLADSTARHSNNAYLPIMIQLTERDTQRKGEWERDREIADPHNRTVDGRAPVAQGSNTLLPRGTAELNSFFLYSFGVPEWIQKNRVSPGALAWSTAFPRCPSITSHDGKKEGGGMVLMLYEGRLSVNPAHLCMCYSSYPFPPIASAQALGDGNWVYS